MQFSFRTKILLVIISVFIIRAANAVPALAASVSLSLPPININTTLDPSITYVIDGTPSIRANVTLTIPAGTHFIFTPQSRIIVFGNIVSNGTAANHVVMVGGTEPPFIPLAKSSLIEAATPIIVSSTVDISKEDYLQKHYGFVFNDGSTGSFSYTDINDAYYAIDIGKVATIAADHLSINNADYGIIGLGGNLTLKNSSFTNTVYPVDWEYGGTFTHSNSSFSNTAIKGWQYDAGALPGDTLVLDSTDGEYYLPNDTIGPRTSLIIKPGVTVFMQDGFGINVSGTFSAEGTESKPITMYGNGVCTSHSPVLAFSQTENISLKYVTFRNVCSGISGKQTIALMSHVTFDTIAGPAVDFNNYSDLTADYITMRDVYQAFTIDIESRLKTTNNTIATVNGNVPAIQISGQTAATILNTTIDGAATCIGILNNSSLVGDMLTLNHCATTGILSNHDSQFGPSGISLANSTIENSGGTFNFTDVVIDDVSKNIFNNDTSGVVLHDMPKTVLINNDWGSSTGPTIDSNPGGKGTKISTTNVAEVEYDPWIGKTAAPEHNPIIIVPGITGSVINKNYGDKSELWPNIPKLALSPTDTFLNDLELTKGGNVSSTRPVTVGDIIRSAGGEDVFDGLIASLLQHGYKEGVDLFVMPYDWRLSNTQTESLLKKSIADALKSSGKEKVNIIAHSAGGLLVKDYLAQNLTTPIDHLFFIAVPHLGAPKSFKALMYGDDMGYNFSLANALSIHVLNPNRIKVITQNMPSVYELLPSKAYIDSVGSYVLDLFGPTPLSNNAAINSYMIAAGRNSALFSFAQTLHDATDGMDFSGTSTYNFVGCGLTKTIGKMVITQKESLGLDGMHVVPEDRLVYRQGDGTVPMVSANAAAGAKTYYVTSGSHGTMPSTTEVEAAIHTVLNNEAIDTSKSITTTSANCAVTGDEVEFHSPVSVDIYDDQGHHTGPTANGDIEFGIPNVDYEIIGDEKFMFLPSGTTYRVVTHAEAVGTYDMYINHSAADDSISHETYFNAVPITSLQATSTIMITPDSNDFTITLDKDGDGTADGTVASSSALNAKEAADQVPPVTTATITNDTVTLTATDGNSGVLNTKYSTDNIQWQLYTKEFTAAPGSTVHFLSMDKAGNVESIKQVTIPTVTVPIVSTPITTINNTTTNITNIPASTDTNTAPNPITDTDDLPQTNNDDTTHPPLVTDTDSPPDQTAQTTPAKDTPLGLPPDVTKSSLTTTATSTIENNDSDSYNAVPQVKNSVAEKVLALPKQLLASVATVNPPHNDIVIMILIVVIVLTIIFIRKRYK
jgi:hypothetical protein